MPVTIIFYGLTRSLKKTIKSLKKNIFKPLNDENIPFQIYIHTYDLNELTNERSSTTTSTTSSPAYWLACCALLILLPAHTLSRAADGVRVHNRPVLDLRPMTGKGVSRV